jgi:hypothetical protein
LDGVSIHPVATQIEASFLTPLMEWKETAQGFHHEDNGDFKPVRVKIQSKMAGIGELRMDQQHCSYATILI